MKATKTSRAPRFRACEEEALFWDTHSPEDFPEEFRGGRCQISTTAMHLAGSAAGTYGGQTIGVYRQGAGSCTPHTRASMDSRAHSHRGCVKISEGEGSNKTHE